MTDDAIHKNLAKNLRYLCDQKQSVTDVCSKTNINRQQFNKYLAGRHRPSAANLRRISEYFGIAPSSLEVPHSDFKNLVAGDYFTILEQIRNMPKSNGIFHAVTAMDQSVANKLVGCYERYQFSSMYPGKILRAAFCIYRKGPLLCHYYIERFPSLDDPNRAEYVFKYHGLTIPLADRIYTVDFESIQRNEITLSIFGLQSRSPRLFVYGLTAGIVATISRPPFTTRIALHYRTPGLLKREHLKRANVLDEDDAGIPTEILEFLSNKRDMIVL